MSLLDAMTLLDDLEAAAAYVGMIRDRPMREPVLATRLREHARRLRNEFSCRQDDSHGTMILCHVNGGPVKP